MKTQRLWLNRLALHTILVSFLGLSATKPVIGQITVRECVEFSGATPQSARDYLSQDPASLETACVDKALRMLRGETEPGSKRILLGYLDFTWLDPIPRSVTMGPTGGEFPAADALSFFEGGVIPDLRKIIQDEDSSSRRRITAARVYFYIQPQHETVSFVASVAREVTDRTTRQEFARWLALMANECRKEDKEKCRAAIDGK